jgi:thiamine pyrophosphate-dependent acetolactate synthase large subunit-like protein
MKDSSEVESVMKEALSYKGVSLVDVSIDYRGNQELAQNLIPNEWN